MYHFFCLVYTNCSVSRVLHLLQIRHPFIALWSLWLCSSFVVALPTISHSWIFWMTFGVLRRIDRFPLYYTLRTPLKSVQILKDAMRKLWWNNKYLTKSRRFKRIETKEKKQIFDWIIHQTPNSLSQYNVYSSISVLYSVLHYQSISVIKMLIYSTITHKVGFSFREQFKQYQWKLIVFRRHLCTAARCIHVHGNVAFLLGRVFQLFIYTRQAMLKCVLHYCVHLARCHRSNTIKQRTNYRKRSHQTEALKWGFVGTVSQSAQNKVTSSNFFFHHRQSTLK